MMMDLCYVLIQLPNVIDKISKRWRSEKAFKSSPCHIFSQADSYRVCLCCGFCDLAVPFWYRQTVPKMGPWKCFSFVLLLSCACGPKNGTTVFNFFFVSGLQKLCFGFNETLWLMATWRATREALLSEAGFEKVLRTQNWVRYSK